MFLIRVLTYKCDLKGSMNFHCFENGCKTRSGIKLGMKSPKHTKGKYPLNFTKRFFARCLSSINVLSGINALC